MKKLLTALIVLTITFSFALAHHEGVADVQPTANEVIGNEELAGCDPTGGCLSEEEGSNSNLELFNYGLIGITIVIIGILFYFNRKKPNNKAFGINLIIVLVLAGLTYYGGSFVIGGGDATQIDFCTDDGTCYRSMHIHAEIFVSTNGEPYSWKLEEGFLNESHIHKEANKIHWHDKFELDSEGEIINNTPLTLGIFMDTQGVQFNSTCFNNGCGTIVMNVNGITNAEYENYVWSDGDEIRIEVTA